MSRITVIGAGVVGQVYAGLLAAGGHDVIVVARGERAARLRTSGVVLEREGQKLRPECHIVGSVADAGTADVVIVAVRGDQLATVQPEVAACDAETIVCMANPLDQREDFLRQVGGERTVFAFSGVGGLITKDGVVAFRAVRQQPTVVDIAAPRGQDVARLLGSTGLRVRSETRMAGWLATHSVFIGGMGSALLAAGGAARVARAAERVHGFVVAVSEAFDALQHGGHQVRPPALRAIFGRVPTWFATRYWQRQFGAPLVQVSIEPHILATRDTEFPRLLDFTLTLVGRAAPRYRALVEPWSTDDDER